MPRLRLASLFTSINVGLLLVAGAAVAFLAVRQLRQLADEQALARVGQAGASARSAVDAAGQELLADARLLSERPTLARLIEAGDLEALQEYLRQFCSSSQLDACAVLRQGEVLADSGAGPDLPGGAAAEYSLSAAAGGPLQLSAYADVPSLPLTQAGVAMWLDADFEARLSDEIGLPVKATGSTTPTASAAHEALRTEAVQSGAAAVARLLDPDRYLAILPLGGPSGEIVGTVEVSLAADALQASLERLSRTLLVLAIVTLGLAIWANLALGRRLARPLQGLIEAAERMGRGNLSTPVAMAPGAEIGTLSTTLEEMRRRLLQLTDDLQREQAESQAILSGIVEGVYAVDRERRIHYVNPQALTMLGLEAQAALGRFCGDVLDPQGPGGVRPCQDDCPIIHARFRGGARATEQLRLPGGAIRSVVIASAPAEGGRQVQVMRDETDQEGARRLRDAVLANITHEFRTPLSAQLASIELLLDQLPDLQPDQVGELVRSLQRGTLRLTQLIDNLLESVRLESGRAGFRRQAVALDEVVEQALELTAPLIEQRGQEVVVDLPYPLPTVPGDGPRLTQVFVNLLANANKYSPAQATIRIGGAERAGSVVVWVEDQGPGLPEGVGVGRFRPFVRSEDEEPEQGGVGLGLWIANSIVQRHGGRIEAASGAGGTRMSVVLPRDGAGENSGG
jgi:signal transduction histidine kinase